MMRPYVICHMLMSIDGKVTGDFLKTAEATEARKDYNRIHRKYNAEAFAAGSTTMEEFYTKGYKLDVSSLAGNKMPREDFKADVDVKKYAVCFDRSGRVGWKNNTIEDEDSGFGGAHIVEVVCECVSDAYLTYLRNNRISYIFAGKEEINLSLAVMKLHSVFGIEKLLLVGGCVTNGMFQREGLMDELSIVQVPVISGVEGRTLFSDSRLERYVIENAETFDSGANWLNYKKKW